MYVVPEPIDNKDINSIIEGPKMSTGQLDRANT